MEDELIARLERWRERHRGRGVLFRAGWVLAGFAVLATGLAMVVLPGPAVVVVPLGLAMLSLEFAWAERLLHASVRRGAQARRRLRIGRLALVGLGLALAATAAGLALLL